MRVRPHGDPAERLPPEEPVRIRTGLAGRHIDYAVGSSGGRALPVSGTWRPAMLPATPRVAATRAPTARGPVDAGALDFPSFWATPVQPPSAPARKACTAICGTSSPTPPPQSWDGPPFGPGGDDAEGVVALPGRYSVASLSDGRPDFDATADGRRGPTRRGIRRAICWRSSTAGKRLHRVAAG